MTGIGCLTPSRLLPPASPAANASRPLAATAPWPLAPPPSSTRTRLKGATASCTLEKTLLFLRLGSSRIISFSQNLHYKMVGESLLAQKTVTYRKASNALFIRYSYHHHYQSKDIHCWTWDYPKDFNSDRFYLPSNSPEGSVTYLICVISLLGYLNFTKSDISCKDHMQRVSQVKSKYLNQ